MGFEPTTFRDLVGCLISDVYTCSFVSVFFHFIPSLCMQRGGRRRSGRSVAE